MRIAYTLLILLLFPCFSISQRISIKKDGSKKVYEVRQTRYDKFDDLQQYFDMHYESEQRFASYKKHNQTAKSLAIIGISALATGLTLFATDAGDCCTSQQKYGILIFISAVPIELAALTFAIISYRNKSSIIIDIYNSFTEVEHIKQNKTPNFDAEIRFGSIGLKLTF